MIFDFLDAFSSLWTRFPRSAQALNLPHTFPDVFNAFPLSLYTFPSYSQPFSTFSTHFQLLDAFSSFWTRFWRSARALNSSHIFSNVFTCLRSRYTHFWTIFTHFRLSAPIFDFWSHFWIFGRVFNAAHDLSTSYTVLNIFTCFCLLYTCFQLILSIFKYFWPFLTRFFIPTTHWHSWK